MLTVLSETPFSDGAFYFEAISAFKVRSEGAPRSMPCSSSLSLSAEKEADGVVLAVGGWRKNVSVRLALR